jgi:hypothetical protein
VARVTYTPSPAFKQAFAPQLKAFLTRACVFVAAEAAARCPVETGFLRRSIGHSVVDEVGIVFASAPYAVFVELGTRYMGPRAFLRGGLTALQRFLR